MFQHRCASRVRAHLSSTTFGQATRAGLEYQANLLSLRASDAAVTSIMCQTNALQYTISGRKDSTNFLERRRNLSPHSTPFNTLNVNMTPRL